MTSARVQVVAGPFYGETGRIEASTGDHGVMVVLDSGVTLPFDADDLVEGYPEDYGIGPDPS